MGKSYPFFTVALLLAVLKRVKSQVSDASETINTNVFLCANVPVLELDLRGVTLEQGRVAVDSYRDILIHVDEVPMYDTENADPYLRCFFLRNIIRWLGLPCLLSGTESSLLYAFEYGHGSRREGINPWAWLLTKFAAQLEEPSTSKYSEYEQLLLRRTRPLFAQWFTDFAPAPAPAPAPGEVVGLSMTPATLSKLKRKMTITKSDSNITSLGKADDEKAWLHASTLLVFADSLQTSDEGDDNLSIDNSTNVGAKRSASSSAPPAGRKKRKIAMDTESHSMLIRNHFAMLSIPRNIESHNGMTKLSIHEDLQLYDDKKNQLVIKAAFKTCIEDPLLFLAGLRDGLVLSYEGSAPVSVPSSFAYKSFQMHTAVGNRRAKSNDGTGLEAECMAAMVLAAHRYPSFRGTPFFEWLALVVAELNHEELFEVTPITDIPQELEAALKSVMVPLLSPPNSPWGDTKDSGITFGNLIWCENAAMRDASCDLQAAGSMEVTAEVATAEGEGLAEGLVDGLVDDTGAYTTLGAKINDVNGFGESKMVAVTKKVAKNSVSVLIGSDLSDWEPGTVEKFAPDVSVYRMNSKDSIVHTSAPQTPWQSGRKVLTALDLKQLHPGRAAALPHAT